MQSLHCGLYMFLGYFSYELRWRLLKPATSAGHQCFRRAGSSDGPGKHPCSIHSYSQRRFGEPGSHMGGIVLCGAMWIKRGGYHLHSSRYAASEWN
jgi:hypothetical protein